MTETQTTLADFITTHRIRLTAERTHENPHMTDSAHMDHYKVVLACGRKRLTTYLSKGFGHKGVHPTAGEVLSALASDATCVASGSFEDFCAEFGYDSDSRQAERTFKACIASAAKLERLLGRDAYQTLLYGVEQE